MSDNTSLTKEPQAPLFISEEEERRSSSNVVDLQFVKKKEEDSRNCCSAGDIFLAASYVTLLLDLFSSGYTLYCTSHPQEDSLLIKVTLAYYGLYLLMSVVLIANSVVELRDLKEREKEMDQKEKRVKYSMEYLTAISAALWLVLCCTSMVMSVGIHNAALQYVSLVISLIAPSMGSVAAFLRVYDTYLSYKKEKNVLLAKAEGGEISKSEEAAANRKAKAYFVRAALYAVIAAFEALHFVGHIWEAYLLVGNTHRLFYITDKLFLVSQVILGSAFIVLAVVERVLENKTEHSLSDEVLASEIGSHSERSTGDSASGVGAVSYPTALIYADSVANDAPSQEVRDFVAMPVAAHERIVLEDYAHASRDVGAVSYPTPLVYADSVANDSAPSQEVQDFVAMPVAAHEQIAR